jgi:hypothetical protein
MMSRVVVWGTGNVGRPAVRAVAAHRDLELAGVVVANPDKVGRDAGELAGLERLGVMATVTGARQLNPHIDADDAELAATIDAMGEEDYRTNP